MTEAIKLPPRRARNKNETTGLVVPILAALNGFPWCQVWRNNVGALRDATGRLLYYGLCPGSSDIVGLVRVDDLHRVRAYRGDATPAAWTTVTPGRFFALEVKTMGKRPSESQREFLALVHRFGGFAGWTDSVDGAIAAAQRARDPRQYQ